jgi:predicted P-loop ATPase
VRDYLNTLTWDGEPRINTWLVVYGGAEDDAKNEADDSLSYLEAVSAIPLMAAVKRIYEPGCKYDEMLVLESSQGLQKSSALRALCPDDAWFSDDLALNIDSKELIECSLGKWIIEASDLSGKRKTEIEKLKAMMSRQVDGPARMAYARKPVERPRHFILIGTTNSEAYLNDPTGARRFWPVKVKKFDVAGIIRDRDQLWAEAVVRVKQGESIRMPEALWQTAGEHQEARREIDPWEEPLRQVLLAIQPSGDERRRVQTATLLDALGLLPAHRDRTAALRVSQIMQRFRFTRTSVRVDGVLATGYVSQEGSDQALTLKETDANAGEGVDPGTPITSRDDEAVPF